MEKTDAGIIGLLRMLKNIRPNNKLEKYFFLKNQLHKFN